MCTDEIFVYAAEKAQVSYLTYRCILEGSFGERFLRSILGSGIWARNPLAGRNLTAFEVNYFYLVHRQLPSWLPGGGAWRRVFICLCGEVPNHICFSEC